MKFMKPCRADIKILRTLQQDLRTYGGNLIYGDYKIASECGGWNVGDGVSCRMESLGKVV